MRLSRRAGRRQKAEGRAIAFAVVLLAASCQVLAVTVDRVAARIDQQVLTVSEINQMAQIRFFPNNDPQQILEALIAQALRFRDVERFGAQDIPKDSIETRLQEIQRRFASPEEFAAAIQKAELTLDEVRALVKRELQVEAYIQERFAPMVFVSNEDIESTYRGAWSEQRRQRGLPIPPLNEVREEIRTLIRSRQLQQEIDRWTAQLRARANVDIYAWR
jgi:hypothetical protein